MRTTTADIRTLNGTTWQTSLPLRDLNLFVTDLENGFASGVTIGGEAVELEAGAEAIELPVGPLLVRGTIPEWRTVIEREIGEMAPLDERPSVKEDDVWEGERMPFPVVDSE